MAAALSNTRALVGGRVAAARPARASVVVRAAVVPGQFSTVAPAGDRVLVKPEVEEQVSVGGILLPSSATKKPTMGVVEAVGEVKDLKVGDKIVYSKFAGTDISTKESEFMLLKEADAIGTLATTSIKDMIPLGDRVLIKVAAAEDTSAGGLLLAGSGAEDKPTLGEVIAVGAGCGGEEGKPIVTAGCTVMYSKYAGAEFEGENDEKYIVVKEGEILASLS